jgi:hypothetical protein
VKETQTSLHSAIKDSHSSDYLETTGSLAVLRPSSWSVELSKLLHPWTFCQIWDRILLWPGTILTMTKRVLIESLFLLNRDCRCFKFVKTRSIMLAKFKAKIKGIKKKAPIGGEKDLKKRIESVCARTLSHICRWQHQVKIL